ncbi:alpha-1,6-mannosyl-glycoprotein 2-beta-N-acetylglucosaminyltransferase [Mustela nigripes]|uniref:Alpha-1,6-mannosyl-glycoprotein 2-beta-N-acetylglucosaminyltransferase n=2 Tax=Mustela putorius furo TaxID=9669 RepID=M3Z7D4_MUSPF|nr:alpha-1,6-mannosyl-glycoprotein 2-beta-N-acetylglucosaminyltransferase [Mustela putorius furo]XP_059229129.1 alpha-1,6-mannosyl-glycoprotein 2-beta-N-acetylglucosaminyltransferase [Mustela nigripes]
MRFRIYKRKVLILTLVVAACGFVLWSSNGRQRKSEALAPPLLDAEPARGAGGRGGDHSAVSVGIRRVSNESAAPLVPAAPQPEADNLTLRYRSLVYQLNFDQTLRNVDKAGSWAPRELVLVVQVHNRPDYLRLLLDSLRKAQGIDNVLVIFSHDFWSTEINQLIAGVDFCPVLQVFFPFSIQLYPNEFPGSDPRDCPRDLEKNAALKMGCINAEYPDSFGHYREAKFSQTKHHWWWKLHFVWERVKVLRDYTGLILFLEEDHYLAPDFYHVFKKMWKLKQEECPECDVLSLGTYTAVRSYHGIADKVDVKTWKSTEHNMGLALTRDAYQKLIECTDTFCTYDDYNWDWTLQYLTVSCLPKFWKVLVPQVPRIFHAGDCGMHHKKTCRPSTQSAQIESLLNNNKQYLFPETLIISEKFMAAISPPRKNGGWGDIRDHELCKSYRRLQ